MGFVELFLLAVGLSMDAFALLCFLGGKMIVVIILAGSPKKPD